MSGRIDLLRLASITSTIVFMVAKFFQLIYQSQMVHTMDFLKVTSPIALFCLMLILCVIDLVLGFIMLFAIITNKKNHLSIASFGALVSLASLMLLMQITSLVFAFGLIRSLHPSDSGPSESQSGYEDVVLLLTQLSFALPTNGLLSYGITLGGIFFYAHYTATD